MGVGVCLYAQHVQTKNKQCKVQLYYNVINHLSDFCFRLWLTQPYNHNTISWCYQNLSSFLLKVSVVSADITLFLVSCSIHLQFWVQKKIFLNHSDIYYLLILGYDL